ncbi:MAG: WD40 repeat domain-containing protein, partial [Limisphaerales bacterium]
SEVMSLAVSREDAYWAAGFQNGRVKIWARTNLSEARWNVKLQVPASFVRWHPKAAQVAVLSSRAGRLILCNLGTNTQLIRVRSPSAARYLCAAYDPTGGSIVVGCSDHRALVFATGTGELRFALPHEDQVLDVRFSPGGERIATASKDGSVRIWDAATGVIVGRSLEHGNAVSRIDFLPGGQHLASGAGDGVLRVWNLARQMPIYRDRGHRGAITSLVCAQDGKQLLSAGADGQMRRHRLISVNRNKMPWLSEIAEVVGGMRLDDERLLRPVSRERYWELLQNVRAAEEGRVFSTWWDDSTNHNQGLRSR